ncbi:MAG: site-specific integrase [Novosphingobium sp.]|nr:site-specific integrase [Novosphingobium sp.]
MRIPLCIKPEDWPPLDRLRWQEAREVTSFLSGPKPAQKWGVERRRIVEQGYGQWLSFLVRNGWLDPDQTPEERATRDHVRLFVLELQQRVSSWSTAMMVQAFARMLAVMAPDRDWAWLGVVVTHLKTIAKAEKDKRGHMVDARQLLALGVELMDQAMEMGERYHAATCMRDGLLIAILASCPVRIANLTAIEIGKQLWFDGDCYRLAFTAEETKNTHAHEADLSPELNYYIDSYLRDHRHRLLARGQGSKTDRLWIDRWGEGMGDRSIRDQIEKRTRDAFGRHVWPHLFRTIAATSFVDHDPDKVMLVSDLLGHASIQTAAKYYILADGARAHDAVQSALEIRRMAAVARLKGMNGAKS